MSLHFSEDAIVWRARSSSLYSLPLNLFAAVFKETAQGQLFRSSTLLIFLKNYFTGSSNSRHYNLPVSFVLTLTNTSLRVRIVNLEITKKSAPEISPKQLGQLGRAICRHWVFPRHPKGFFQEPHEFYFSLNSSYRLKQQKICSEKESHLGHIFSERSLVSQGFLRTELCLEILNFYVEIRKWWGKSTTKSIFFLFHCRTKDNFRDAILISIKGKNRLMNYNRLNLIKDFERQFDIAWTCAASWART